MASDADDARNRARAHFDAGEFSQSRGAALQGLRLAPDDVELLVLAGRAGVELDAPDAIEHLRRAIELAPDDGDVWHSLGEALAAEGSTAEADDAFRRAVELNPEDQVALMHLGHTSLAAGRAEEGVGYLSRAANSIHDASTAVVSLVDMYRSFGQYEEAIAQARRLADATPNDIIAWLDIAELSLMIGRFDDAREAFDRLRELDETPGREAYPLYGMIQVEIRREHWESAVELAEQVAAIDPHGLGADVVAFLRSEGDEAPERPVTTRADLDASLTASLTDYRRMHADDRRMGTRQLLG
jgi:tetratricopeptide (TPR) repeat protein